MGDYTCFFANANLLLIRYKPLIVVSAFMGVVIWSLMLWTETLGALQTIEVFYGTYMATEVAYYTYIYAKVEREHFQKVTSFTKSAILAGRFLAGVVAQVMVSFKLMNLRELNYLSFGCKCGIYRIISIFRITHRFRIVSAAQIISLVWAIALPAVGTSLYFHASNSTSNRKSTSLEPDSDLERSVKGQQSIGMNDNGDAIDQNGYSSIKHVSMGDQTRRAVSLLWHHFIESYSDPVVVLWSLWWALALCGFTQVQMYMQLLWRVINPDHENVWNGAVEATLTLLGVAGAFAAGFINNKRFEAWNRWVLTVCSATLGGVLLWGTLTDSVWISYVAYVIFGMLMHFMVTLAR